MTDLPNYPNPIPKRIVLEIKRGVINLRVYATNTLHGSFVIESVTFKTGKCLPGLRVAGRKYAERFSIPFIDETL